MDKFLEGLFGSIERLYYLYEDFIWKNDNSKLNILVQDNMICFYLYNEDLVIDEIILSFEEKEKSLYEYVCVRLLLIILGNVMIKREDNEFYNDTHKSYVRFIVNDVDVMNKMIGIVNLQDREIISDNMDEVRNMKKKLVRKRYSDKFIDRINERIDVSKLILRRCGK